MPRELTSPLSDDIDTSPNRAAEVYEELRRAIVEGRIRPNERLIELELARALNVSRTPVRESILQLVADGLVVSRRRGWVVREHSLDEIREIYEVRAALEGFAANLAAVRATDEQLDEIAGIHRQYVAALDETSRGHLIQHNDAFHDAVVAASGNTRLAEQIKRNSQFYFVHRIGGFWSDEEVRASIAGHQALVDALLARLPETAERVARAGVLEASTEPSRGSDSGYGSAATKGIQPMRATLIYGAGDIRIEDVPDPKLIESTDAIVRVTRSCICGSDLWPYGSKEPVEHGDRIGHEFIGVIEDIGSDVTGLSVGDVVVAPFVWSDNTCDFCREGLQTSCRHGGGWGRNGVDGGQGEAVRVPQASGTLVRLPVGEDAALMPSLLTLSDVFSTGHHCAVTAGVNARTSVTVIGDGAVGLSAVLAAKRLGAERIILMGRHQARTDLGREFGATDVVAERGEEGVAKVLELTMGDGTHTVLECVGLRPAIETAFAVVRDGGAVSRVGAPQYSEVPADFDVFLRNITLTGGVAPARAYIEELLPDVLDGTIEPGRVFDRTVDLDGVPDGYRAMADREALKVMITP